MTTAIEIEESRRALSVQDSYFSVDVETDGPIPGSYSMLAFAVVEAGHHNGKRYVEPETSDSKYWELAPISEQYDSEALSVNGLDRSQLARHGQAPADAMYEAARWIRDRAGDRRAVMVGAPAAFDWMFMHWYFIQFTGASPFGHSSCFDIKTAVSVKFDRPIARSGRSNVPRWMDSDLAHTHNALDDANEQAQVFSNLMQWRGVTHNAPF